MATLTDLADSLQATSDLAYQIEALYRSSGMDAGRRKKIRAAGFSCRFQAGSIRDLASAMNNGDEQPIQATAQEASNEAPKAKKSRRSRKSA